MQKVPMLAEGYERLTTDLKALREERPRIVDAIEEARAHGDLSENAEYHAAKERQGQVEAQIADIEDRVTRAQIIDPTTLSGEKIVFGATVTLRDENDKPVTYQIVGQTEAGREQGPYFVQFTIGARVDRQAQGRRDRGDRAFGRQVLFGREDRVQVRRRSIAQLWIATPSSLNSRRPVTA